MLLQARRLMLLEVSDLSKAYGGVHAVQGCSFSVDEAEIVGLIGPNGAGKSTVISLISGFETPDSGRVRFCGVDVTNQAVHTRAHQGLVRTFQLAHVWGRLTVMENMLVAASRPEREVMWRQFLTPNRLGVAEERDRLRAREVLAEFQLMGLKDTPAEQLSGGQKRLLEFARIVMVQPRLVLLDEPSASLSPYMSARIGEGIIGFAARGIAVLLVEHDLPLVEATSSRILCMSSGKVITKAQ